MHDGPAHGALLTALRTAESCGLDIETGLRAAIGAGALGDVRDLASVLHHRLDRWATSAGATPDQPGGRLIAGTVPRALGITDRDLQRALDQRETAMEQPAHALAEAAIDSAEPWLLDLGPRPDDPEEEASWLDAVAAAAVQREQMSAGGCTQPTPWSLPRRLTSAGVGRAPQPQRPALGDPPDASQTPTAQPVTI